MPIVRRHLTVHGRVQGVGYRWSMVQAAQRIGAAGWVRNRRDGTVEALVVAEADAAQALIDWAREGPEGARVERVDVTAAADGGERFDGFAQRDTV